MYCNVKSLLLNEIRPEFYQMDRETDNENFLKIENPIERFYIYKSKNVSKSSVYQGAVKYKELYKEFSQSVIDCDNCDLVKNIYQILWSKAISDSYNSTIDGQHGDTMTSLQCSLNLVFNLVETKNEHQKYFKGTKISLAYQLELLYYVDDFLSRMKKIKGFEKIAGMYHTVGNFIPVPPMFNRARANFGKDDYWDLTLTKIKKWYDVHDNRIIAELLHKEDSNHIAVVLCIKWLTWYKNWLNFISENYLQDFINPSNLEPICFKPSSSKDIEKFFDDCSALIEKRGKRMIKELRKRYNCFGY